MSETEAKAVRELVEDVSQLPQDKQNYVFGYAAGMAALLRGQKKETEEEEQE